MPPYVTHNIAMVIHLSAASKIDGNVGNVLEWFWQGNIRSITNIPLANTIAPSAKKRQQNVYVVFYGKLSFVVHVVWERYFLTDWLLLRLITNIWLWYQMNRNGFFLNWGAQIASDVGGKKRNKEIIIIRSMLISVKNDKFQDKKK